ncbi:MULTISPECIES: DUF6114 domain-containing protein [Streptomyces]|uniref:Integral membrane protein n=1 Tax=Streptomyces albus (strain ATCC 21838 / DSM 41398 / FERM P-419 / JCM 4703 / NBRC 107858) TaxID=1081613 RepID=A0A0B5EL46_STRA4|nr:DUF6114 domain-containing protein [Streptomyces sp. SCSIO ZS0520]AJE82244.1 integral membrane protein [Streptomyces albus]AOU76561.1 integral membrane protein [Streptomyces albus]
MSAEAQAGLGGGSKVGRFGEWRRSFRNWRGQRPFWAGLLTILGGLPIMYFPYANLTLGTMTIRMATTAGAGSLIIGVLLVVLGLTMWFQRHSRVFAGVAAILLALVSLVVSNFGGFVIGFLLALIGGALGVSWAEEKPVKGAAKRTVEGSQPAAAGAAGEAGEASDLSGTSPTNGTNGRHRAG